MLSVKDGSLRYEDGIRPKLSHYYVAEFSVTREDEPCRYVVRCVRDFFGSPRFEVAFQESPILVSPRNTRNFKLICEIREMRGY